MSVTEAIKITGKTLDKFPDVIEVFASVKKAYALTNAKFGFLPEKQANKKALHYRTSLFIQKKFINGISRWRPGKLWPARR